MTRHRLNAGREAFVPHQAKPKHYRLQFKNAAGKNRARANMAAQGKDDEPNLVLYANPGDLTKVPVIQGFDTAFATQMRGDARRNQVRKIMSDIAVKKEAAE